MKRALSFLLALCLLTGIVPTLAMSAGAKGLNRYTSTLETLIAQRVGSKTYGNQGLFYDLDGDGIEEMLIVRTRTNKQYGVPEVTANLYTIVNGKPAALLTDEVLYVEAGGPTGYMAVVESSGKTMLGIFTENGGTSPPAMKRNGAVTLYTINQNTGKLTTNTSVTYSYTAEFGNKIHDTTATMNGKAITYEQYQSWVKGLTLKATVNYFDEKTKYTFEDLLNQSKADNTGDLPSTTVGGFSDVRASAYYADAVVWAVENGVTSGAGNGTFNPTGPCTRDQIVTFLWNAANNPEPASVGGFSDMPSNKSFQKAISWAVENGIAAGAGGGKFSPKSKCTRAQAVTFIWRAHGSPEPQAMANFTDMPKNEQFRKAISWAVENGVAAGAGGNKFAPDGTCERAQIVTFLYHAKDL